MGGGAAPPASKRAVLARAALIAFALVVIGCTRGGPHPEPPRSMQPTGPAGNQGDAGATPDMTPSTDAGSAAGSGGSAAGAGGASGAAGAGPEPTGSDCPDAGAGAADGGNVVHSSAPCQTEDEDAGALR